MSLRYRKSLGIAGNFVRLNVSKSGLSTSIGVPGCHVNVPLTGQKRSPRLTVGVPGTGLSYSQNLKSSEAPPADEQTVRFKGSLSAEEQVARFKGRPSIEFINYQRQQRDQGKKELEDLEAKLRAEYGSNMPEDLEASLANDWEELRKLNAWIDSLPGSLPEVLPDPTVESSQRAAYWVGVIGFAIALILIFTIVGHAQSRKTPIYDANGRYNGSVFDYGRTQTYTDRNGHFSGSAVNNSNGTWSFFNRNGQFSGSAGSSIDRAFNFNKR
jgi:hypothetical protein